MSSKRRRSRNRFLSVLNWPGRKKSKPRIASESASGRTLETLECRRMLSGDPQLLAQIPAGEFFLEGGNLPFSDPQQLVEIDGTIYFSAMTDSHVRRLWKTDGTLEGTTIVSESAPASYSTTLSGSVIPDTSPLTNVNGTLFFGSRDRPYALWKSDGTAEGTVLVKDIIPDSYDDSLFFMGSIDDTLYFAVDGMDDGTRDLWKSDGTPEGTVLVKDMIDLAASIKPDVISWGRSINYNGTFYFESGHNIHRTDGTEQGTHKITDLSIPLASPADFREYNDRLFFSSRNSLWSTNGEIGGEVLIKEFPRNRYVYMKVVVGDTMYFRVDNQVWKTDGTTEGTVPVDYFRDSEFVSGSVRSFNDMLFFRAEDSSGGKELWKTDGTEQGTVRVKDIKPGAESSNPSHLIVFGDKLVFNADSQNGRELWITDGTDAGTIQISEFSTGRFDTEPDAMRVLGNKLFFSMNTNEFGRQLWETDGTKAGTKLVKNVLVNPLGDADPAQFTQVGGEVYFTASTTHYGTELWRTDGTEAGTVQVGDLTPGPADSKFFNLIASNGRLVFALDDGNSGIEPWVSNGTDAGTMRVKDINPNGSSIDYSPGGFYVLPAFPQPFSPFQGELFFSANDDLNGPELWKTDGTESGTVLVKDINPGAYGSYPGGITVPYNYLNFLSSGFVESSGTLFFVAGTNTEGFELWKTDGTENGTVLVKDIRPGFEVPGDIYDYFHVSNLTDVNGTLFFTASDNDSDFELWKSDGTDSGTVRVKDINPGPDPSFPVVLTAVEDTLFFLASDGQSGFALWKSDGTNVGTVPIKELPSTAGVSDFLSGERLAVSGETLFFMLHDDIHGSELWKSDGTESGTVLVADIFSGSYGSYPNYLTAVSGGVAFVASDGVNGSELWASDGTAEGTFLVSDLLPGSGGSSPRELTYIGTQLFFSADDGTTGRQPWVVDLVVASVADAGGPYTVDEGASVVLSATDSTGDLVSFDWDFDNDGQYDDATGVNATFDAVAPGVFTVGLRINGIDGPTDSTTVTVLPESAQIGGPYSGDQGTLIALSAAESVGGLIEWDLDNDGQYDDATGEEVDFDATAAGVFSVGLRVNGPGGSTDATTVTVMPETAVIGGPYLGDQGTLIALTATASVGGLFEWDLDNDGQYDDATGANVGFNAVAGGVFTVGLRVNGPGGPTDTTTVSVVPEIADIGGPYFGDPGTLVALSAAGSVGGLFEWDLDNDGQYDDASGVNVDFYATVAGVFTVGLRVNGPGGSSDSTTVSIEEAIAVIGGPYSGDQGTLIALSAAASSGTLFEWDLDSDGQYDDAEGVNVLFDASVSGAFTIGLRVNGPTGPTDSTTVSVTPESADIGGPYSGDEATFVTLNAGASVGGLLEWDLDNDGQYDDATGLEAVFNAATAGVFTVGLRVNGAGGPTDSTTVTVLPESADIGGAYTGVEGMLIPLTAAASVGGLFEWDLDNDGQYDDATGVSADFVTTQRGVYTIGLRVNGPGGPVDTTTVTVNNAPPTATLSGNNELYRGETANFTLIAEDPSPSDQAGLFTFDIDWDGNGTVDQMVAGVPSGTSVQHTFPAVRASYNIQVRATDQGGVTGSFSQTPIAVRSHVVRNNAQGTTDLIWGGTPGLDAVFVIGSSPTLMLFSSFENSAHANRFDFVGATISGKIILHGYGFADVLIGELALGNVLEIYGGDGDDVIVGGFRGDELHGEAGNDVILGGTGAFDGSDLIFGGDGLDTLFGHHGADTLNGGAGEDLLISDRFSFSDVPQAVLQIGEEWKSARPFAERVSNILGVTSTGVNGTSILSPGVTIIDDAAPDTLFGGLGELDWLFYDFDQDLLGDAIELSEEETDSDP